MTQLTTLDAGEITEWLTRVTHTIDKSLRDTARGDAVAQLRVDLDVKVGLPVLAQLALLDDLLRVAHIAIEANGAIEIDDIARVSELVNVAAAKYFAVLPIYDSFDDGAPSPAAVEHFLVVHRNDPGAFGYANRQSWRGLHLARFVESTTRNAAPLRDLERMLVRVMDHVFAGRATKASLGSAEARSDAERRADKASLGSAEARSDAKRRADQIEKDARRKLRDLFEPPPAPGLDPRAVAFCRADGPEVFSSVAHGSQIHERDPFDVESIHSEIRDVFHRLLVRATTPEQHQHGHGRTLLVLGDSGSGKTHLLRALRQQTHSQRLGYVGYMQMSTEVGDYARYVLRNLIDSLERPYDPPALTESGLLYLSDGLAEGHADLPRRDLETLRGDELTGDALDELIGRMVDKILRTERLERLEPDLIHALLLLQRRDPAIQRRVIRFLRCEMLSPYEQRLLGGLPPRDQPEDPMRMIRQLGAIAYELQLASLVLLVDQVEDTVPDGKTVTRLQQAVDVLRAIADAVPSAIVVLSCLDDVYTALRGHLSRSLVDRLERDPGPMRLASQRNRDEIEAMLVRRLDELYSAFDVELQDDDQIYPFTNEQLDAVNLFRARDAIAKFREIHESCVATGTVSRRAALQPPAPPPPPPPAAVDLDRAWNDALAGAAGLPDDDGILDLVAEALRGVSDELGIVLTIHRNPTQLIIEGKTIARRIVEVCNTSAQGGHLGNQLDGMRTLTKTGAIPIALRSSDFQFKPKTKISRQVGEFIAAGGLAIVLEERQLRAIVAARSIRTAHPDAFGAWQRANRPITHLVFIRQMLDLDHVPRVIAHVSTKPIPEPRPPAKPAPRASASSSGPIVVDPSEIRLGETTTMRKEPVSLPLDQITRHLAFLGTTGSGKTTAALAVAEQLLERDVSVLLVDRKGDLARYASGAWWLSEPDRERKAALRDRIDVALYTPGNPQGRPLRLPVVPVLADATTQERVELAKFAASGLGAMMGYGTSNTHRHKQSVLQCAIQLHAEDRDVTIELLCDTINRPDPELLTAVGSLQRFFAPLSEDLQSLMIQRGSLLGGEGEMLDAYALLPPQGTRPMLSIVNTAALTEVSVLQFWISRLLIELGRLARKRPTKTLQGAVFLDEADAYVPAVGAPPTKEPMFDLLRRGRSGGLGILLATQNPGDFDYKARDLIGTWLVGKVAQDRAIEKMRNLLANYPNVGPRLATQPVGHFFVLAEGVREIKCDRSLMATEQLPEHEVIELARALAT